jgi:ABC-type phosphate/phosphonate transport system substrate-binding protein
MTGRRRFILSCAASFAATRRGVCADASRDSNRRVRVAVSGSMLGDVNENDARASVIVWADTLSRQSGLAVEYNRDIMVTPAGMIEAIRRFQLDAFAFTVPEYLQVAQFVEPDSLVLDETSGAEGSEYVLLVHRNKSIRTMADLKGRTLLFHKSPHTCLAPAWLDGAFARLSPGGFDRYLGAVVHQVKLSKVVLPVFFQQADAAVAQLRSFQTMSELNPQLSRELQVLAKSPRLVSGMLAFHRQFPAGRREAFRAALLGLHQSTTGKQALTMFQTGRLLPADQTALRSAMEIVAASDRVRGRVQKNKA